MGSPVRLRMKIRVNGRYSAAGGEQTGPRTANDAGHLPEKKRFWASESEKTRSRQPIRAGLPGGERWSPTTAEAHHAAAASGTTGAERRSAKDGILIGTTRVTTGLS
jgi:hypothetical protein